MKRIQLPKKLLSALCAAALLVGAMPGALAAESTQQVPIQRQSIATNAGVFTYIDAQGGLWSWGHSLTGGVGNGTTSSTTGTPEKILDNVVFVSSGLNNNGAAIQSDCSLWTWGDNWTGQLGNGLQGDGSNTLGVFQTRPGKIMDDVASVSCGYGHTGIVKNDGTLWMCGNNEWGQLGNGGKGNDTYFSGNQNKPMQTVPVKVMENVKAVSCGTAHTAAIKEDGSLWMWGRNDSGALGNGKQGNRTKMDRYAWQDVPVKVMDDVQAVSCGWEYTVALKTDGSVWVCGDNNYGQLGNGGTGNDKNVVGGPVQSVWTKIMDNGAAISTSNPLTAIVCTDGSLWTCGGDGSGRIGTGKRSDVALTPVKIMDNVAEVSVGYNGSMAVTKDGSLWVWGETNLDMDYANQAWAPVRLEGVKVLLPDGTVSQPTEKPEQAELRHSGSTTLEKLSKEEIVQLLKQASTTLPNPVLTKEPSIQAPYATGAVDHQALEAAAQRLNVLRRLAGVPQVRLDDSLSENAQYGAVLLAHLGSLNHTPTKPSDMDNSFYQKAYEATSTSNIAAGMDLLESVDMFMQDSDARNVERVGHRRWQLNPELGRVGFGYAQNPDSIYRDFVTEKVTDTSGSGCDYDFIGWPASGSFPNYLDSFDSNTAWSVVLNPDDYQVPTQSGLVVTLVRQSDGKTWTLDGKASYTPAASGRYFNVETSGVGNCIIFRPDGVSKYEGVYQVTIDGLKDRSGKAVDFTYQVDFFSQPDPNASKPSDWAAASVQEAIQMNLVPVALQSGYTQTATRQEICALVVRFYETVTGSPVQGRVSFSDTKDEDVEKAAYLGIVNGVGDGSFHPNDPLTREQAAVMLTRLALQMSKYLPPAEANFTDRAEISPWALEATGTIQGCGIMNGVGGGRFAPSLSYSREQCITTLMRLYHYISQ